MTKATGFARRALPMLAGLLVIALVVGAFVVLRPGQDRTHVTVDFDRTVSIYKDSTVRILGVTVGTVDSIEPRGTKVRVTMSWDSSYDVPADAKAVIVSPAIVGDRYVQLTPAYDGGSTMDDDTYLDQTRTAIPTELDETLSSLDEISVALGPEGANKDGELSRLLSTTADNVEGQGDDVHQSIEALADLSGILDDNKSELFGSVEKLEKFVSVLDDNDDAVRDFNTSLADVSSVLAGERDDLSAALKALAQALGEVQGFVKENRTSLRKNVDGLAHVTQVLAKQRKSLASALDLGPQALANIAATYNPTTGTLDARTTLKDPDGNFTTLVNPAYISPYCALARDNGNASQDTCTAVGKILDQLATNISSASGGSGSRASDQTSARTLGPDASLPDLMGVGDL